jgi:hypothetical protein
MEYKTNSGGLLVAFAFDLMLSPDSDFILFDLIRCKCNRGSISRLLVVVMRYKSHNNPYLAD